MAEYEERSLEDLTEEPSAQRLEELREKGQVAQSRDLTGTLALFGVFVAAYFFSNKFYLLLTDYMRSVFSKSLVLDRSGETVGLIPVEISHLGMESVKLIVFSFLMVSLGGLVVGLITALAQTGFLFTTETISPDFERLNPLSGFLRLFSWKSFIEGMKACLKAITVIVVVYLSIKAKWIDLPNIVGYSIEQILSFIGQAIVNVFSGVFVLMLALSGLDYWIQYRQFRKQAMMTKAEAKQELKEREGDPQIKARIRSIQRDMARKRMMKSVPKADVIVTNPTHIAVALSYKAEENFAPRVVAKGADFLAERIRKIAAENGIPLVENKQLARSLYKSVKVGQLIPRSMYQAVAEILAYVYRLKGRNGLRSGPEMRPN